MTSYWAPAACSRSRSWWFSTGRRRWRWWTSRNASHPLDALTAWVSDRCVECIDKLQCHIHIVQNKAKCWTNKKISDKGSMTFFAIDLEVVHKLYRFCVKSYTCICICSGSLIPLMTPPLLVKNPSVSVMIGYHFLPITTVQVRWSQCALKIWTQYDLTCVYLDRKITVMYVWCIGTSCHCLRMIAFSGGVQSCKQYNLPTQKKQQNNFLSGRYLCYL